jgi:phage-related protein
MAESLGMYYYGVGIDLSQMTAGISKAISTIETGSKQMQAALQSVVTSMEQNAGGISGAMNGAASAAKGAADKIQNDQIKFIVRPNKPQKICITPSSLPGIEW